MTAAPVIVEASTTNNRYDKIGVCNLALMLHGGSRAEALRKTYFEVRGILAEPQLAVQELGCWH